jgi:DNA polymerase elongation subunit (family B)
MIGHAIESSSRSFPRMYYIFTWGGAVDLPTHDRKGNPMPKRKVVMKIYKNESQMLLHWVRWRRSTAISPGIIATDNKKLDCMIGWNIYGFDLGFLATRIRILEGMIFYTIVNLRKRYARRCKRMGKIEWLCY